MVAGQNLPNNSAGINAGLEYSRGMAFSTIDRDQDASSSDCAKFSGGAGLWFCTCCTANLNGKKTTSNAEDDEEMYYNPVLCDERMLASSVMTMIRYDSFENRKSNNEIKEDSIEFD